MVDTKNKELVEELDSHVLVAEGSEYERKIPKTLPRGKANRGVTHRIIKSIVGMEGIAGQASENIGLSDLGTAMERMFDSPDFMEVLVPTVFGLRDPSTGKVSKEDQEWLDNLTDMDIMPAFVECAGFIAQNGDLTRAVEVATKKSRPGKEGAQSNL